MKKPKQITFEGITYKKHEFVLVAKLRNCDICIRSRRARYDACCYFGHWANLCTQHFRVYDGKLGLGVGQIMITLAEYKEICNG